MCTKWEFTNSVSYSFSGVTSYFPPNYCSPDAVNAIGEGVFTTPIAETIEETFIFNNIPDSQLSDTTTMLFCGLNGSNEPFRHIAYNNPQIIPFEKSGNCNILFL